MYPRKEKKMTPITLLFVPAKAKPLSNLPIQSAESYILDLEDSIEPADKPHALTRVTTFLTQYAGDQQIYVRLNQSTLEKEAKHLDQFPTTGFMIPKFENVDNFSQDTLDIWKRHKIIALIETPRGIVDIDKIAACDWIDAIALGAEDYTAAMNMENSIQTLAFAKSRLVTYAKAYGKKVYDTPSLHLNDEPQLKLETQNAVSLGFDGKLAIHPKQLPIIQSLFRNHNINIEEMKRIVALYEKEGKAVLTIDNRIYEKMHINRMKKIIKEQEE